MKDLLDKLNKYTKDDEKINNVYTYLLSFNDKKFTISELETLLNFLNVHLSLIKKNDQISLSKKNKISNILNEIILFYNECLMNEICKQI